MNKTNINGILYNDGSKITFKSGQFTESPHPQNYGVKAKIIPYNATAKIVGYDDNKLICKPIAYRPVVYQSGSYEELLNNFSIDTNTNDVYTTEYVTALDKKCPYVCVQLVQNGNVFARHIVFHYKGKYGDLGEFNRIYRAYLEDNKDEFLAMVPGKYVTNEFHIDNFYPDTSMYYPYLYSSKVIRNEVENGNLTPGHYAYGATLEYNSEGKIEVGVTNDSVLEFDFKTNKYTAKSVDMEYETDFIFIIRLKPNA